jgi:predicted Zn-dependent protease
MFAHDAKRAAGPARFPQYRIGRRELIASAAAVALLAPAALAAAPDLPAQDSLPRAEEERLGEIWRRGYQQARGTAPSPRSERLEAYLTEIGNRLTATGLRRPMTYSYHFDADPGFKSAMAMPGGQIVVGSGLMAIVDGEDALACVIGHEIMHCDLDHTTGRFHDLQARLHLDNAHRGDINPLYFGASYTPEQELAADLEGFRMAVAAGYSPYGARRLLAYFAELLRPHPGDPPRALPIERRLAQLDADIAARHWEHLAEVRHPLQLPA